MNEIIKFDFDKQTVSARELHEKLISCESFYDLFVEVSKEKVVRNWFELRELLNVLDDSFALKYGSDGILYLRDCISCEMALPCKNRKTTDGSQ